MPGQGEVNEKLPWRLVFSKHFKGAVAGFLSDVRTESLQSYAAASRQAKQLKTFPPPSLTRSANGRARTNSL